MDCLPDWNQGFMISFYHANQRWYCETITVAMVFCRMSPILFHIYIKLSGKGLLDPWGEASPDNTKHHFYFLSDAGEAVETESVYGVSDGVNEINKQKQGKTGYCYANCHTNGGGVQSTMRPLKDHICCLRSAY